MITSASTMKPTSTPQPRWIHSVQAASSPSGGTSRPLQRGQSTQPMPEPVLRTMAPMTTIT